MIGMLLTSNYSGPGEPVFRPRPDGYGLLPRLPSCRVLFSGIKRAPREDLVPIGMIKPSGPGC